MVFQILLELIVPKHKIHSTNQPEEGHILCDPGYDYWMIMENTAMLFPRSISVLYRFDLGESRLNSFDPMISSNKLHYQANYHSNSHYYN